MVLELVDFSQKEEGKTKARMGRQLNKKKTFSNTFWLPFLIQIFALNIKFGKSQLFLISIAITANELFLIGGVTYMFNKQKKNKSLLIYIFIFFHCQTARIILIGLIS